ncbi:hypothetical protein DFH06DRAFT_991444, partial [Mycena polygramma]
LQTRKHLLHECPRYEGQQHNLREVSRDISLPEILGTKKGIEALAEFLDKLGAFTKPGVPQNEQTLPSFDNEPEPEESDGESDDKG